MTSWPLGWLFNVWIWITGTGPTASKLRPDSSQLLEVSIVDGFSDTNDAEAVKAGLLSFPMLRDAWV